MLISVIKDILPVIIFLSLLIVANKKFNIKQKLRSKFSTDDTYRFTLLFIVVFSMIIHNFISKESFMSSTLGATINFSFLYLANISNKKH